MSNIYNTKAANMLPNRHKLCCRRRLNYADVKQMRQIHLHKPLLPDRHKNRLGRLSPNRRYILIPHGKTDKKPPHTKQNKTPDYITVRSLTGAEHVRQ